MPKLTRNNIGPLTKEGRFLSPAVIMRRWRAVDPERARSRWRKWREANPHYWTHLGNRYSRMKQTAKRRGLTVTISLEEYRELVWGRGCHYCGTGLDDKAGWSLDRLNNTEGYTLGNCVPCCYWCNYMKMNHTVEEFYAHIKRILSRASLLESTKQE